MSKVRTLYIATGLQHFEKAQKLAEELRGRAKLRLTFDWTQIGPAWGKGEEFLRGIAAQEFMGVVKADVFIAILPGYAGTHTEIGIALGEGKSIYICSEDPSIFTDRKGTCSFYHLPQVTHITGNSSTWADQIIEKVFKNGINSENTKPQM